jgi:hypothetical protein
LDGAALFLGFQPAWDEMVAPSVLSAVLEEQLEQVRVRLSVLMWMLSLAQVRENLLGLWLVKPLV